MSAGESCCSSIKKTTNISPVERAMHYMRRLSPYASATCNVGARGDAGGNLAPQTATSERREIAMKWTVAALGFEQSKSVSAEANNRARAVRGS